MGGAGSGASGPRGVGVAGVILLIGGYALLAYISDAAGPGDRLASLARVAFYAGVLLVAAAVVLWYRQPDLPPEPEDGEDAGDD